MPRVTQLVCPRARTHTKPVWSKIQCSFVCITACFFLKLYIFLFIKQTYSIGFLLSCTSWLIFAEVNSPPTKCLYSSAQKVDLLESYFSFILWVLNMTHRYRNKNLITYYFKNVVFICGICVFELRIDQNWSVCLKIRIDLAKKQELSTSVWWVIIPSPPLAERRAHNKVEVSRVVGPHNSSQH